MLTNSLKYYFWIGIAISPEIIPTIPTNGNRGGGRWKVGEVYASALSRHLG